jgi:arylsulfatase A-like enzyme
VKEYAPRGHPFFLELDQRAPHIGGDPDPFGRCERAAMPQSGDRRAFAEARPPRPPSFNEVDMSDKPPFLAGAPKLTTVELRRATRRWRCALGSLVGVDRGVRKLYEAIRDARELRKTVFLFTSDNGFFYGEHRIGHGKVLPYEEAVREPLLIRLPRRYRDGARRVRQVGKPVANIDLAPTILDLANAEPCRNRGHCRTLDGRSLMPLLTRSRGWPSGRGLLTEYREPDLGRYSTCQFAGIRTRRAAYTEHYRVVDPSTGNCVDSTPPQVERYGLRADPFELDNLCFGGAMGNCPADTEQLELEVRLATLRDCAGVAGRDGHVGGHPFCE